MKEKIKNLIADQLCISPDDIADDADIVNDLGADSLDIVEMLMTLEDEFGVKIPDDQANKIRSVNAICEIIKKQFSVYDKAATKEAAFILQILT